MPESDVSEGENRLPAWADWSGDSAVTALRRAASDLGRVPKYQDYNDYQSGRDSFPSPDTIRRAYGGYREALAAAGFDYREIFGSLDEARDLVTTDGGKPMSQTTTHDDETARIEYEEPANLEVAKGVLDALGVDYTVTVSVAISVDGQTMVVEREADTDLLGKISEDDPGRDFGSGLFESNSEGGVSGPEPESSTEDEINLTYGPTAVAILEHPDEWVTTAQIAEHRGIDRKTPSANVSHLHKSGVTDRKEVPNDNGKKVYAYRIKDEHRDMVREYADA